MDELFPDHPCSFSKICPRSLASNLRLSSSNEHIMCSLELNSYKLEAKDLGQGLKLLRPNWILTVCKHGMNDLIATEQLRGRGAVCWASVGGLNKRTEARTPVCASLVSESYPGQDGPDQQCPHSLHSTGRGQLS